MKSHLFVPMLLVSVTSSLMGMLPELPHMKECKKLIFLLDSRGSIKTYSIKTTIKVPVQNIKGNNFFALSPFKDSQVEDHFKQACFQPATIRAILRLENKEFLSKISPVVETEFELPYYLLTLKPLDNL